MPNTRLETTEHANASALDGAAVADTEAHLPTLETHLALDLSDNDALVPGSPEANLLCRNLTTLAPFVLSMMRDTVDCTGELRVPFKNACITNRAGSRPKRLID